MTRPAIIQAGRSVGRAVGVQGTESQWGVGTPAQVEPFTGTDPQVSVLSGPATARVVANFRLADSQDAALFASLTNIELDRRAPAIRAVTFNNTAGLKRVSVNAAFRSDLERNTMFDWLRGRFSSPNVIGTLSRHSCPHAQDEGEGGWYNCQDDPRSNYQTVTVS